MSDVIDEEFIQAILSAEQEILTECSTTTSYRFMSTSENELESLRKSRIPQTTLEKVKWGVNLFCKWHREWSSRLDDGLKVFKDLDQMDKSDLNYCLKFFLSDVRKENGQEYPPRTLKEIVACIQHHFNYELKQPWSIFKDEAFMEAREILDAVMKRSARHGNVKEKKRAAPISIESEEKLWKTGVFGRGTPRQVVDTLIYYFGIHFSLRARQEQRDLSYGENSQISVEKDSKGVERLKYVERVSKNKSYGINSSRKEPKITYIYKHPDKNRCIIELYRFYLSHRPEAHSMPGNEAFYLTPIQKPKNDVWYKNVPMGIHTISGTISRLMKGIDDGQFYSNTSLRRTAKTRLVVGGISKEIAMKKTGHASNADLNYVDPESLEEKMCDTIYGRQHHSEALQVSSAAAMNNVDNNADNERQNYPKQIRLSFGDFLFEATF